MKAPLITAHSGCEQTPRDSMESVERAIALGADAIEMDIRRAADGTLYVSHDRQMGGAVREKATLETVFRRIQDTGLKINCDIKEAFALCGTLDMAERFGLGSDRLILSGSVSPELLAMEPSITERASVFLNIEEVLKFLYMGNLYAKQDEARFPLLMTDAKLFVLEMRKDERCVAAMIRLMKALHVHTLNMPHDILTMELAETLRAEDITCSVWTVNEVADLDRCLQLGVDNITTLAVRTAMERRKVQQKKVVCV